MHPRSASTACAVPTGTKQAPKEASGSVIFERRHYNTAGSLCRRNALTVNGAVACFGVRDSQYEVEVDFRLPARPLA
jgi:hypothetical protein